MGSTKQVVGIFATVCLVCLATAVYAAEDNPAAAPAAPAAPAAAAPLAAPAGGMPALPTMPAAPTAPSAVAPAEGGPPPLTGAVATPPPLPGLEAITGQANETSPSASSAPAAPVELYEFLYLKHDEYGPVRIKVSPQEAEKIREKEINNLMRNFPGQPQQQAQGGQQQDASRAFAEWDYFFEQLDLYSQYVKEVILPEKKEDLRDPSYDLSSQEAVAQERNSLKSEYEKAAQELTNEQRDENIQFYEKLQQREDRRKRYYEWIASQQKQIDEWARVWARSVHGNQWVTASGEIRRDDWYYGTNFNPGEPVRKEIDGQAFVFSSEPVGNVAENELNVITTNLTPYDIIDSYGVLKNPSTELQRGTRVEPPRLEDTSTPSSAGIIELKE